MRDGKNLVLFPEGSTWSWKIVWAQDDEVVTTLASSEGYDTPEVALRSAMRDWEEP